MNDNFFTKLKTELKCNQLKKKTVKCIFAKSKNNNEARQEKKMLETSKLQNEENREKIYIHYSKINIKNRRSIIDTHTYTRWMNVWISLNF